MTVPIAFMKAVPLRKPIASSNAMFSAFCVLSVLGNLLVHKIAARRCLVSKALVKSLVVVEAEVSVQPTT